jgi:hypothetical protein
MFLKTSSNILLDDILPFSRQRSELSLLLSIAWIRFERPLASDADPGCLSQILDPDFCPSRIQKQNQNRGVTKNLLSHHFFVATNITKLKIILILNW